MKWPHLPLCGVPFTDQWFLKTCVLVKVSFHLNIYDIKMFPCAPPEALSYSLDHLYVSIVTSKATLVCMCPPSGSSVYM